MLGWRQRGQRGNGEKHDPANGNVRIIVGGRFLGVVASFIPMIFGLLVFPLAVSSPTPGEDIVGFAVNCSVTLRLIVGEEGLTIMDCNTTGVPTIWMKGDDILDR